MSADSPTQTAEHCSPADVLARIDTAVFALDENWQFTFVNDRAGTLFDRDPATLVGEHARESVPALVGGTALAEFETAMETGDPVQFACETPTRRTRCEVRAYPSDTGLTVCFDERGTEARNDAFRAFHDVTTDETLSFAEQVRAVLDRGAEYLDLADGELTTIDGDSYTVEHATATSDDVDLDAQFDLEGTVVGHVLERGDVVAFTSPGDDTRRLPSRGSEPAPDAFIGTPVNVDGTPAGTLGFHKQESRARPFTEDERTFVRVLAQWLGKELSRRESRDRAEANRDRLRQIIDMLPQLVFAKDRTGEFLLVNEAVAEVYGTTVEDLEGATDADFAESAAQAEQFREDDLAVIESAEAKRIAAEPLTTAAGEELMMQTTKIPYDPVDHDLEAVLGVATDITDRIQREEELEVQSAAMEASMDGIAILDGDEYVYMNQAHADVFDYEPDELVGSDWRRVYGEAEVERLEAEVFPTLDADGEWRGETRGLTREGDPVYQEITLSLLDDGKLICTNRDVTGRKEREEELQRQRTRLRALFDKSPDGIIVHDAEGAVIDANETEAESLGYDRETLLSMNVADFEAGMDRDELTTLWAEMDEDELLKVEGQHRGADGETFPVEVWVNKVTVDGNERFIAVSRDVTDRKAREQELKRSREFIERAQESASIGGWGVDLETDRLRWSDEVYRIHDLSPDADVTLEDALSFYHPADRPTLKAAFERLRTEGEPYDIELRIVTAADRVRWVRVAGDAQFDDDGEVDSVLGIAQDITDRKEREQELRDLKERLDLAVEGANLGIWDWNMETDDVTFNEQWASMLGLDLAEIDSHLETWEQRVHPEDMQRVEAKLDEHLDGDAALYDCEHRMRTADGDWKWVKDVGKVVERDADGTPTRAVGIHLDISDRKESEQALESERDMFAQGPAVVFEWENAPGWPVAYASDNVTETLGYTPEELEGGSLPFAELIHDEDLPAVEAEVDERTDGTTDRFGLTPYRVVTKDGAVRWVRVNTKVLRTDGEITHYLGYLVDITAQKELETSLRESEQSLRQLTEIGADTDQSFEAKLGALLELGADRLDLPFGFLTRIEQGTQHIVEGVGDHPLLTAEATAPLEEAYCRKTIERDTVLHIEDAVADGWEGDPAYERFDLGCYIGGKVEVNGELYGTLCFADRTPRDHEFDQADRAFVELLVQWISYELASDAFESKLQRLNDTAQQLMGAPSPADIAEIGAESATSVLDMPMTGIWWYDADADALVPALMTDEAADLFDEQPTFGPGDSLAWEAFDSGEIRVYDDPTDAPQLHNEETALQSEAIVPLGDHGILATGSVEPRAFSEKRLNLLEVLAATLEAGLDRARREGELRETRRKLEQSNEELEQFAYAASHDLQEPLRTVTSYLTLLERRYREDLDADATEFIDFATDGADRMREMIQALLTYSRVDTRGEAFEPTPVAEVFDRVTRNLELTIQETGATVETPTTDATIEGDSSQLVQLFQNLLENAIKYSEGDPHVEITVDHRGGDLAIAVEDDGIGMAPDQREEIFEVFQRLHTREEYEGTGIGLALCRKIVDRHDGEIRVESEPGAGSTFTVTLPAGGDVDA